MRAGVGGLGLILEVDRLAIRNMAKSAVSGNRVKKYKKILKGKKKRKGGSTERRGNRNSWSVFELVFFQKEN